MIFYCQLDLLKMGVVKLKQKYEKWWEIFMFSRYNKLLCVHWFI